MRNIAPYQFVWIILWVGFGSDHRSIAQDSTDAIAVVELFTSQGCSSCPPADQVLSNIASAADENSLPVHVLSFHVDYWNDLGWSDPYSHEGHSQRQRRYASVLNSRRVYTPQMIVNGTEAFVGSNARLATAAIRRALDREPVHNIALEIDSAADSSTVRYSVDGPLPGRVVNLAVVTQNLANPVPRGENRGRQLHHTNVVQFFTTISLNDSDGQWRIPTPPTSLQGPDELGGRPTVDSETIAPANLIAYVQEIATGKITGASSKVLP